MEKINRKEVLYYIHPLTAQEFSCNPLLIFFSSWQWNLEEKIPCSACILQAEWGDKVTGIRYPLD